jgi:4-hydroxybenzoate polyprenyltransferase
VGEKLRAYFELLRFPAVFTVVADVMMGFLVTRGSLHPPAGFVILTIISACLYLAGMVLNDVFDAEIDATERPQRPIPSGRISHTSAAILGWCLIAFALVIAVHFSQHSEQWRTTIVAFALAGCILLYDSGAKHTFAGPLVMGGCRTLNVLLGMSLATDPGSPLLRGWSPVEWAIALAIGLYIAGVTWVARGEAKSSWRQRTVRTALRLIIVIDAAIVLGFCGPFWGTAVLALLVPMLLLERWASTT